MSVADPPAGDASPDGITLLSLSDPLYPPLLRQIPDPPQHLWVRGDPHFLQRPQLAVVGARRASAAALRLTTGLCADLVAAGLQVTSGLALGVDGAAHRGALDAGGSTVAVMATGIDDIYPQRHRELAARVLQAGCLVTEFPPGTAPRGWQFPRRNRIITGLSLGVLVVEAALPSGSLISAATATKQGREVFTLPWSIAHSSGAGCLQLLRDGSKMVRTIDDILEELEPMCALQRQSQPELRREPEEDDAVSELLALIGFEPVSLDALLAGGDITPAQLLAELSRLELEGRIQRCPGGYIRC